MIKTFTGPMFSGKTANLLTTYFNMWNKKNILCFKPKINTRDEGIKSKKFTESVDAIEINNLKDILKYIKKNTYKYKYYYCRKYKNYIYRRS